MGDAHVITGGGPTPHLWLSTGHASVAIATAHMSQTPLLGYSPDQPTVGGGGSRSPSISLSLVPTNLPSAAAGFGRRIDRHPPPTL